MPLDLRIIRIKEFLQFNPSGTVDFPRAIEILTSIAQSHGETDQSILLDLRHTHKPSLISDRQIWELVHSVMVLFPGTFRNKLALVDKETSDVDREEFFVNCANAIGFPTKLFTSFEAAIEWFGEPLEMSSQAS